MIELNLDMESAKTEIALLRFDEIESILYIKIIEGAEMNIENTKRHYEIIKKLTAKKPYAALIDSTIYFTIDGESLKYVSLPETIGSRIASAHYNSNLANKLTTNFFRNYYKPTLPLELFKSKDEALEWLKIQVKLHLT